MLDLDIEKVAGLLSRLGTEIVMPSFRALSSGDVDEKGPGDFVTRSDREVEHRLGEELVRLYPGSECIGEEACHLNPALLEKLGDGWTWLIDPIDGTRNFVAGDPDFAIMVALLRDGETVASWMHAPAAGWSAACERGAGATLDGASVVMPSHSTPRVSSTPGFFPVALKGASRLYGLPIRMSGRAAARPDVTTTPLSGAGSAF